MDMKSGIEIINNYYEQFYELTEEFINLSDMIDAALEEAYQEGKNSEQNNKQ